MFNKDFDRCEVGIVHHFSSGLYAKETLIPAGVRLTQHKHGYDHLSILASGTAVVEVDGEATKYTGPACLTIKAGSAHEVTAITDVVWFCLHATEETDPEKVDHVLHEDQTA